MNSRISLFVLSLLFSTSLVSATLSGVAASVDIGVIDEMKSTFTPLFIDVINSITMPEIDVDNFEITEVKVDMLPLDPLFV
jgi:hypothetical protein